MGRRNFGICLGMSISRKHALADTTQVSVLILIVALKIIIEAKEQSLLMIKD